MSNLISYLRFKRQNLGEYVDADGKFGFQCMDLIRHYCREVYNFNMWKTGQARDVNNTHTLPGRKKLIIGTEDFKKGDIIVLDLGKYGHIGIVDKIEKDGISILEQNGSGKGSGQKIPGNEIRVKKYPRGKVINCFRFVK